MIMSSDLVLNRSIAIFTCLYIHTYIYIYIYICIYIYSLQCTLFILKHGHRKHINTGNEQPPNAEPIVVTQQSIHRIILSCCLVPDPALFFVSHNRCPHVSAMVLKKKPPKLCPHLFLRITVVTVVSKSRRRGHRPSAGTCGHHSLHLLRQSWSHEPH